MNRLPVFWATLWFACATIVVAAIVGNIYARIFIAAWVVVSFFVAPPKPWPAFQRLLRRWVGRDAQAYFSLRVDRTEFDKAVAERAKKGSGRAGAAAGDGKASADTGGADGGNHDGGDGNDGEPRYLFCSHPHGVFTVFINFTWGISGVWDKIGMPSMRPLIGTGFWFLPLAREFYSWLGAGPVSRSFVRRQFAKGGNLGLVPGGFEEAVLAQPGTADVWVRHNKGFVALALRHGYNLVPMWGFGEVEITQQAQCKRITRAKIAGATRIPMIAPKRPFLKSVPVTTVVGAPLWLPRIEKPTPEEVDVWHTKYMDALRQVYDDHKAEHGMADVPMRMY